MALTLKTNEVIKLRKGTVLKITDGPNDWDLWLSYRGTLPGVAFAVEEPFSIPPLFDITYTSVEGQVSTLDNGYQKSFYILRLWKISGVMEKSNCPVFFRAEYDPKKRTGTLTITSIE